MEYNQQNKQASNVTRDTEIKNKQIVTRGVGGGDYRKEGKGHQGTCMKDPWTKSKGDKIEGWRWAWVGERRLVGGKGR